MSNVKATLADISNPKELAKCDMTICFPDGSRVRFRSPSFDDYRVSCSLYMHRVWNKKGRLKAVYYQELIAKLATGDSHHAFEIGGLVFAPTSHFLSV
jgi:hypothetical protein